VGAALDLAAAGTFAAGDSALVVCAVDGLTRIRPDDSQTHQASIHLKAARNEYEPFQVVVRAGPDALKAVKVEVSDLRGEGGHVIGRRHIALYREHFVEVKMPSPKSKEGAGWYPDALIPFVNPFTGAPLTGGRFAGAPFEVDSRKNQPVWVDVFVPKDAAAGDYTGTVTVTAKNQSPVTLPVRLTVWNFTLPDKPSLRSNFGGFGSRVAKTHKVEANGSEFRLVERRYAEAMAAHRLCPPIPSYLRPKTHPDGTIDSTATHAALQEWMATLRVTGFPLNLIGSDPLGKDRERAGRHLQAMYACLKTNGWEKSAYIYVLDEPNDAAAYEQVRQRARLIHEAQPGIQVLCTEQPTPQKPEWGTLVGSVDIWVPLWPLFEEQAGAERLAAGEELWSYTALCQGDKGKDTPFWEIDFPLLNYRIPAWLSWRYGMTGLLYWTTVYWEKAGDVWTNPRTYGEGRAVFNGEGALFYPGADAGLDGPVASMRLKQIREGFEDYEYLKLLADAGEKDSVNQAVRRLARSWTDWETSAAQLNAAREAVAARLSERAGASIGPTRGPLRVHPASSGGTTNGGPGPASRLLSLGKRASRCSVSAPTSVRQRSLTPRGA
jgi:hypothetical protein